MFNNFRLTVYNVSIKVAVIVQSIHLKFLSKDVNNEYYFKKWPLLLFCCVVSPIHYRYIHVLQSTCSKPVYYLTHLSLISFQYPRLKPFDTILNYFWMYSMFSLAKRIYLQKSRWTIKNRMRKNKMFTQVSIELPLKCFIFLVIKML